jgi:hypothetical protein
MGRPTDFTLELGDEICRRMTEEIRSLRNLCRDDDMPGISTVLRWLADKDPAKDVFREQYAHAREALADGYAEESIEIADDGSHDSYTDERGNERIDHEVVNRSRLRCDQRKWYASKLFPRRYADKMQHVGGSADDAPIAHSIEVTFVEAQKGEGGE